MHLLEWGRRQEVLDHHQKIGVRTEFLDVFILRNGQNPSAVFRLCITYPCRSQRLHQSRWRWPHLTLSPLLSKPLPLTQYPLQRLSMADDSGGCGTTFTFTFVCSHERGSGTIGWINFTLRTSYILPSPHVTYILVPGATCIYVYVRPPLDICGLHTNVPHAFRFNLPQSRLRPEYRSATANILPASW